MKIISLGGVGGCILAETIRKLNQPSYPYDWLITSQSFIIKSFNNFDKFFIFEKQYIYFNPDHYGNPVKLLEENKSAIMLHDFKLYDFNNFIIEKNEIVAKYKRRFERLNDDMISDEPILFVRVADNLNEMLMPLHWYDDIFCREEEDIGKWNDFIGSVALLYNKKIKLLFITSDEKHINCNNLNKYNNVIVHFTKDHKNVEKIGEIIQQLRLQSLYLF